MITGAAVYHVVEATAPLYTAAVLGYASVRWFKAFTAEQCAGINHFAAIYAVPLLIFRMVSTTDPYTMNGRLLAADTLQKAAILLTLTSWALFWFRRRRGRKAASPLRWVVTGFSVATLPNTIIMGVPLLDGMYGAVSGGLMKQIVVMQFCVWYNVIIFLYEYMAAHRAAAARARSAMISPESSVAPKAVPAENAREGNGNSAAAPPAPEVAVQMEGTEMAEATSTIQDIATDNTAPEKDETDLEVSPPAPEPSARDVIWMACKKLLKIPNTYAIFLGLLWALVAFKYGFKMPKIIDDSLSIISTTAVGLSMFASGTFIAWQSQFVPCGYVIASLSMVIKFVIGPVVMLVSSLAVGLHGKLLHIAVVQAALPLAVSSFVYAEEYKVHADIMSTGVILGILVSLPVTMVYYILLGLMEKMQPTQ